MLMALPSRCLPNKMFQAGEDVFINNTYFHLSIAEVFIQSITSGMAVVAQDDTDMVLLQEFGNNYLFRQPPGSTDLSLFSPVFYF
jgi:hypothetical protein